MPKLSDFIQDRELFPVGKGTAKVTGVKSYIPENELTSKGTKAYPSIIMEFEMDNLTDSMFFSTNPKIIGMLAEALVKLDVSTEEDIPSPDNIEDLADFIEGVALGKYVDIKVKHQTYNGRESSQIYIQGLSDSAGL